MGKTAINIIMFCLFLCCSGCRTSDNFNYIEKSIQEQIYPAKLVEDISFSIGSLSMRVLNGFVDNDQEAGMYMKEIKKVQVGVYKIHNVDKRESFKIPDNVEKSMIKKGWDPFVRVRKRNGENVMLFYRQFSEKRASIFVIALERDELSIVEINGNLDNILEKAICEHSLRVVDRL
jgi:hypothetical protein